MGRWGDREQGKRLKGKGKRDKFNLSPLPLSLSPLTIPDSLFSFSVIFEY
jgi:hypothetical protein